jgi:predicted small metal-binding protein
MRAVECWCGQLVQGEDEEELVRRLREHVREAHGGEHDDDAVRARVNERAYEPPTGDPPWAY